MKSQIDRKRIIKSCRTLMSAVVVIMLCNLLPLGGSVAAVGKRESADVSPHVRSAPDQLTTAQLSVAHNRLPIMFEANLGQTDSQVKFLSRGPGYTIFLTPTEAVVLLSKGQLSDSQTRRTQAVLRMKIVGGAADSQVVGLEELRGKSNYFIGSDPQKWRTDVPLYARVQYKAIYPGIDLVYYGNQHELEYDFVVASGADPAQIKLSFDGAQKIRTDANGDLVLKTPGGEVRQRKPHVYQEIEGVKKQIKGRYVLKGSREVGFALAGYDRDKPLIIDPVLTYASYLGGKAWDEARGIAVDSNGYAYVTGHTYSTNFPSKNAFQPTLTPYYPTVPVSEPWKGQDAFVTKFDPSKAGADSLIYSTFLGGTFEERGVGIAVDSNGNAYVTGTTNSVDTTRTTEYAEAEFPVVNAYRAHLNNGGFDWPNTCYCDDAFVTKLSAGGNSLLYSTYFGGSGADRVSAIAIDAFANVYIIGTRGNEMPIRHESYNFPLRQEFQSALDNADAYIAKFDTNSSGDASLIFSTFLGGGGDNGYGIAVTPSGSNVYVTGATGAPDFPTKNAYQPQIGNGANVFVTVFNDTRPLTLLYSTFLGGADTGNSEGTAIAVDSSGNAYVTGLANNQFPTRNRVPGTFARGAFISKINPSLIGDASLIYSTCLATSNAGQRGTGIAVDADGYAYVTGYVDQNGGILTKEPIQPYGGGNYDAFVAKLNPLGNDLAYSTHLGGSLIDQGLGIAIDAAGNAYVAGFTTSINFPTTPGAYSGTRPPGSPSPNPNDARDAFVARISEKRANLVITTTASPNPVVTGDNLTYTITVTNLGPDPAHTVIVTDDLAPEAGFVSSTPETTGSYNSRSIRFDSIAVGASVSITIDAMVSCFASDGTIITNIATVTSLTYDPDTGNNSTSLETIASNPPPEITCPADIVSLSPIVNYPMPTVVDNCLGLMMTRCSPPSGSTFPVGTTTVICEISDAGGNGSKCGFTVTVRGNRR